MAAAAASRTTHMDVALALVFFTASSFILTIVSVVSPYWLWLDNQPGTADNNAETLEDRYQGLWYSCTFKIQGTATGVNIERRTCLTTASLTAGAEVPEQLGGIQALSIIGVVLTFITLLLSWSGARPASTSDEARGNRGVTAGSCVSAVVCAVIQFIALIMYATDPYITAARSDSATSRFYVWGSGFNCLVTSFVFCVVAAALAAWGSCLWGARAAVLPKKPAATVAVTAPAGSHTVVVVRRDPLNAAEAAPGSAVALIAAARAAAADARAAWGQATGDLANGRATEEQLDAAVALSRVEVDAADAARAKAAEERAAEESADTKRAFIYASAQSSQAMKRHSDREAARDAFLVARAEGAAAAVSSPNTAMAAADRSAVASEAAVEAATHAAAVPSAGAVVAAQAEAEAEAKEEAEDAKEEEEEEAKEEEAADEAEEKAEAKEEEEAAAPADDAKTQE